MSKLLPLAPLRTHWNGLAQREKRLVTIASALVALVLLWWIGIAPALRVLQQSGAQQRLLEAQLQQMQAMAAQARELQGRPAIRSEDAVRSLGASVRSDLGAGAQISFAGERANVTLKGVPASALARWLSQARINSRALPVEARLTRAAGNPALWEGTIVLTLPPK